MGKFHFSVLFLFLLVFSMVFLVGAEEKTVAVLDFEDNIQRYFPPPRKLGQVAGENLGVILSRESGFRVVERERLEEILKEHELSMSGLTDDEDTTAELGKLAGAAYVITGSLNYLDLQEETFSGYGITSTRVEASMEASIKMIDVSTGVIEFASIVTAEKEYQGKTKSDLDINSVARELLGDILQEFVRETRKLSSEEE